MKNDVYCYYYDDFGKRHMDLLTEILRKKFDFVYDNELNHGFYNYNINIFDDRLLSINLCDELDFDLNY